MAANSDIAFKRLPVKIIGTGSYVPERRLTNADLEKMVDTSHEWIIERTGIVERRIAAPDEYTSHMGTKAAQRALELTRNGYAASAAAKAAAQGTSYSKSEVYKQLLALQAD